MSLRLIAVHARWMIAELWRQPAYLVSTLAFPALFYLIFAAPESTTRQAANMLMASFAAFGVFGVIFLQFGAGLAQERSQSWYRFLRTLPTPPLTLMAARFTAAMFFAALTAAVVILLAIAITPAELSRQEWLKFLAGLMGGALAFCSFGAALGFWSNEKTSLPIGNLIYLPLTFAGGLWKPPSLLPSAIRTVSEYLPTRFYGEILWATVRGGNIRARDVWGLAAYALVTAGIAFWGHRRGYRTAGEA